MNFLCQGFQKLSSGRHNARQTTYAWSFLLQSCDKDGGHTIQSAVFENSMLHANLMTLSFMEPELWVIKVYIAGIGSLHTVGS